MLVAGLVGRVAGYRIPVAACAMGQRLSNPSTSSLPSSSDSLTRLTLQCLTSAFSIWYVGGYFRSAHTRSAFEPQRVLRPARPSNSKSLTETYLAVVCNFDRLFAFSCRFDVGLVREYKARLGKLCVLCGSENRATTSVAFSYCLGLPRAGVRSLTKCRVWTILEWA